MEQLVTIFMQIIGYVPPQLMVVAIITYLIWFHQSHKKEHALMLQRLDTAEASNFVASEEMSSMHKLVLRSCIVNEAIPRSARLEMYDDYKSRGFNSWVDHYVEEHLMNPIEPHNRRKEDKVED